MAVATIYLDFGPMWRTEATGHWTVREAEGGLVMEHPAAPSVPATGATARIVAPVFSAPVRKLLRFCLRVDAPAAAGLSLTISAKVDAAVVWRGNLRDCAGAAGYWEAALVDPMGGDVTVTLQVEDTQGSTDPSPARVVWSQARPEILGWGEKAPAWGREGD